MQNKTEMVGVRLPDKVKQLLVSHKRQVRMAGSVAAGAVLANSLIIGGIAPFGISLVAAMPGKYNYGAAAGAVLGYVLSAQPLNNIKYIIALVVTVLLRWILTEKRAVAFSGFLAIGTALAGIGVGCISALVSTDFTVYDLVMCLAEMMLTAGSAWFFSRTLSVLALGFTGASRSDISSCVVSLAVILMGISSISPGGVSVGRILSVLIILLCARYGGEAAGAVAGVTAGIAMGIAGRDYAYVVSSYAFGGLIAGVFGHTSRLVTACAFVLVNALSVLFIGEEIAVYHAIFEIFIASAIFIAIPQSLIARLKFSGLGIRETGETARSVLRDRLGRISGALRDISTTTHEVSKKLGKLEDNGLATVVVQVTDTVCKHCGMKTTCWDFKPAETEQAMNGCMDVLKKSGSINRGSVPKYLSINCCRLEALLTELNLRFQEHIARQGVQRKVSRVRSVVTDQFEGMATMLEEISGELYAIKMLEPQKTKRVQEYFEREGIGCEKVFCYSDEYDRITVELILPAWQVARFNKLEAALGLCTLLDADFDAPQISVREKTA